MKFFLSVAPVLIVVYGNRLLEYFLHLSLIYQTYMETQKDDVENFNSYRFTFITLVFTFLAPTVIFYSGFVKTLYEHRQFEETPGQNMCKRIVKRILKVLFLTCFSLPYIYLSEVCFYIQEFALVVSSLS